MGDPKEIFTRIDVPKERSAIAVPDGRRGGEVRFIDEVDSSADAMKPILQRITAKDEIRRGALLRRSRADSIRIASLDIPAGPLLPCRRPGEDRPA